MDCQSVLYKNKILVLGGYDFTNGHYHDSIEEFDGHKWTTLDVTMDQPLRSFGLGFFTDISLNNYSK